MLRATFFSLVALFLFLFEFEVIETMFIRTAVLGVVMLFGVLLTPFSWWLFIPVIFLPQATVMAVAMPIFLILFIIQFATVL